MHIILCIFIENFWKQHKKIITYIALRKEPYKTIRSLNFCNPLEFYLSNGILFIFIMVRYMVGLVLQELHKFIEIPS